jgi:chitinase
MVGAEEDVQSLRRRDGSHLEVFDCPNPEPGNFSVQTLKAVCMAEGREDSNCEDITLGSVRGTIARLPEDCGPDEWVRVVSFRAVPGHPLPHHLAKRAPENATVYEIRYDYNFRRLRRDGGEVYVRVDASDHPGYWDKIVSSVKASSKRSYAPHEWREFHMSWFEKHGYTNGNGTTGGRGKRGFGTASWWSDAFNSLLKSGTEYGFHKKYSFSQVLYSASKSCPGTLDARVEARIEGTFETRLDYGISLIGTLKNFNFDEAYAYFSMSKMVADGRGIVDAHAAFQIQSQKAPILQSLDPFGGSFNIKGLFEVGPYVDITAQLQASITASGAVTAGIRLGASTLTWMYPKSLTTWPGKDEIQPWPSYNTPTAGAAVGASIQGSLTVSILPAMGFQIIMAYGGSSLVNTQIKATMQSDIIWRAGASASPEMCDGVYYALDGGLGVTISLTNPLPGWNQDSQNYTVYPYTTADLLPFTCYPWNTSSSTSTRRHLDGPVEAWPAVEGGDSGGGLSRRAVIDSLFPDGLGSMIACPTDFYSDTGDCNVEVGDYTGEYADVAARDTSSSAPGTGHDGDGAFEPSLWTDVDAPTEGNDTATLSETRLATPKLAKRVSSKPPFDMCDGPGVRDSPADILRKFGPDKLSFPSSGDMINKRAGYNEDSFLSYGPLNPGDCDDYSFGLVATPPPSQSTEFASEHVLEWQILKDFLLKSPKMSPLIAAKRPNPAAAGLKGGRLLAKDPNDPKSKGESTPEWMYCSYMCFWWSRYVAPEMITYDGLTDYPIYIVNKAFPNKDKHVSELQLLSKEANNFKERLWSNGVIRLENLMDNYVTSDVNKAVNNCKQLMFAVKYVSGPGLASHC